MKTKLLAATAAVLILAGCSDSGTPPEEAVINLVTGLKDKDTWVDDDGTMSVVKKSEKPYTLEARRVQNGIDGEVLSFKAERKDDCNYMLTGTVRDARKPDRGEGTFNWALDFTNMTTARPTYDGGIELVGANVECVVGPARFCEMMASNFSSSLLPIYYGTALDKANKISREDTQARVDKMVKHFREAVCKPKS